MAAGGTPRSRRRQPGQRLATGAARRAAMRAPLGTTINHTIRIARAIPCHARSLAVPPWSLLLAWRSIALLSPRRRYARIPRCLRRLPKLGFQRRNTIQQRQDQPILLLRAQAGKVGTSHRNVDSYSDLQRNPLLPNRRILPPVEGALRS